MDAAYLEAALPKPFTVLGKHLKPFCLGHEILFQRFGNKFSIESKEEPTVEDLLTGVHICAQPYSKDVSLDGFSIPFRVRLFSKLMGIKYVANAFLLFSNYIATHSVIPDFFAKETGQSDRHGAPTIQSVKVSLMANLGLSEDDSLNTPFGLAFWNHLTWAEAQGSIQIMDDEWKRKIVETRDNEASLRALANKLFPKGYSADA